MKRNGYYEFIKRLKECRLCGEDLGFEPKPIVWGAPEAKIVQISQAPSKTVKETGKPFNDQSGVRLREWYKISKDSFYDKKLFYMTAISHCYPGKDTRGKDSKPSLTCAKQWLHEELSMIDNEIYIVIGELAAKFLFVGNFNELVFNDQILRGKPAYVLPHPSPQNIKWFKDHEEFYHNRLPRIRSVVHEITC